MRGHSRKVVRMVCAEGQGPQGTSQTLPLTTQLELRAGMGGGDQAGAGVLGDR